MQLTKDEKEVLIVTSKITSKHDLESMLEIKNIKDIILKLYKNNLYKNKNIKQMLDKYIKVLKNEGRKTIYQMPTEISDSNVLSFSSIECMEKMLRRSKKDFLENIKTLKSRKEITTDSNFSNILINFREHIDLKTKLEIISSAPSILIKYDIGLDILEDKEGFKRYLIEEMLSLYPKRNIFLNELKDYTFEAINNFTEEDWFSVSSWDKLHKVNSIYRNNFEKFMFNCCYINKEEIDIEILKKYFKNKKTNMFCEITDYDEELISFIKNDKIKLNKKMLLTTKRRKISEKEMLFLKTKNIVVYPLFGDQLESYGRESYLNDLFCFIREVKSFKNPNTSKTIAMFNENIRSMLTINEFLTIRKITKEEEGTGKGLLLDRMTFKSEFLSFVDGELDVESFLNIEELNEKV